MFDELSFGICWYNDPSIFRLLDSLPKQAKKIIVDGKFKMNPSKQDLSFKYLRDKVLEYDNIELIDAPNLDEPRKRDLYLIDNPYKYLIIMDSDEFIVSHRWDDFFNAIKDIDDGIHNLVGFNGIRILVDQPWNTGNDEFIRASGNTNGDKWNHIDTLIRKSIQLLTMGFSYNRVEHLLKEYRRGLRYGEDKR